MILWKRAALLGLLSWAIPFLISFLVFPVKQVNAPLFDTAMALVVVLTAGALFGVYFRDRSVTPGEAMLVSLLWLAANLVLDYDVCLRSNEDDHREVLLRNRAGLSHISGIRLRGGTAGGYAQIRGGWLTSR